LKRGRRSSRDRDYEVGPVTDRTGRRIYAALPAPEPRRWSFPTLASITQGQPVSRAVAAARSVANVVQVPLGKSVRIHAGARPVTQKWFLVDKRTGEVVQETHRRESIGTLEERRCLEAKDARRHFVIKSGYGGKNGATSYRQWKEC